MKTRRRARPAGCCRWRSFGKTRPTGGLPSRLALARVRRGRRVGLLTDAFALPTSRIALLQALAPEPQIDACGRRDALSQQRHAGREQLRDFAGRRVNWLAAEQSNSSLTIGDALMLKIYRRISAGEHPEAEMGRYLTAQASPMRHRCSATSSALVRDGHRSRWPSRSASFAIRATPGRGPSIISARALDSLPLRKQPHDIEPTCSPIAKL